MMTFGIAIALYKELLRWSYLLLKARTLRFAFKIEIFYLKSAIMNFSFPPAMDGDFFW